MPKPNTKFLTGPSLPRSLPPRRPRGRSRDSPFKAASRRCLTTQNHPSVAKRGSRPSAPKDRRAASTYIIGAIRPKQGKGAALVPPACEAFAMNLPLAEISKNVALECACGSRRRSSRLAYDGQTQSSPPISPSSPCPQNAPKLNPAENVWQFLRDNWLSNRVFKSYDDIVDHRCDAWNKLVDHPWRIMSIGLRDWAHKF